MPLMLYGGGLLVVDGALAISEDCCCVVVGGCCPGILIPSAPAGIPPVIGSVLVVELIGDTTGCFIVGSTMNMVDTTGGIWLSSAGGTLGFFGNTAWNGLELNCAEIIEGEQQLTLKWAGTDCPLIPSAPIWTQEQGVCDPFEFIFSYDLDEIDLTPTPGCTCSGVAIPGTVQGSVTVKITIL